MTPATHLLRETVRDAGKDAPYVVEDVDDGFDLNLEERPRGDAITVTDVVRQVDGIAGAPAAPRRRSGRRSSSWW